MERQKFDEAWKDAFKGAGVEPSDHVWTNIELDLEKAQGGKMKRRLLFFQLLAAASMVFAMGIGGVYYLTDTSFTSNTTQSLSQNDLSSVQPQAEIENESSSTSREPLESSAATSSRNEKSLPKQKDPTTASPQSKPSDLINLQSQAGVTTSDFTSQRKTNPLTTGRSVASVSALPTDEEKQYRELIGTGDTGRPLPAIAVFASPTLAFKKEEEDEGLKLLAKLKAREQQFAMLDEEEKNKKNKSGERTWTSLGFGAGTFNPNATTPTAPLAGFGPSGTSRASSSNPSAGSSYSVGLAVGTKVSNRIVIQGGLTYLTQNASFTSSATDGTSATLNEFSTGTFNAAATAPYRVESNLQYLSIPVQAGYVLLDRAFSIQLNGGVATDLFLQNTLTPDNKRISKSSQGPGDDSPYKSVNFTGLVGTELSYRVTDRYRVVLNPGMRYALNSIYKDDVPAEVSPVTFDVSLRFRYIFQ